MVSLLLQTFSLFYSDIWSSGVILGSVLELADTLIENVAPTISPVMKTLVSVSVAITEPFCAPSICW